MNKLKALEELANVCLHCGKKPKAFYQDYVGDMYVGDEYMLECECGIETQWNSSEITLKTWNSNYEKFIKTQIS